MVIQGVERRRRYGLVAFIVGVVVAGFAAAIVVGYLIAVATAQWTVFEAVFFFSLLYFFPLALLVGIVLGIIAWVRAARAHAPVWRPVWALALCVAVIVGAILLYVGTVH
jgi:hypothetical protein